MWCRHGPFLSLCSAFRPRASERRICRFGRNLLSLRLLHTTYVSKQILYVRNSSLLLSRCSKRTLNAPAFAAKKTKVIFVSNDRDAQNYEESCKKVIGIDVMDYDLSKTAQMRDLFGLKTIPAVMILRIKTSTKMNHL